MSEVFPCPKRASDQAASSDCVELVLESFASSPPSRAAPPVAFSRAARRSSAASLARASLSLTFFFTFSKISAILLWEIFPILGPFSFFSSPPDTTGCKSFMLPYFIFSNNFAILLSFSGPSLPSPSLATVLTASPSLSFSFFPSVSFTSLLTSLFFFPSFRVAKKRLGRMPYSTPPLPAEKDTILPNEPAPRIIFYGTRRPPI
mmetsp:Transcript_11234/g.16237  ORF Transcript_11234/g.16237 Transcript_11234/m.16237 type:complete len:204 (-) Transcript_11234:61-672(-)